MNRRDLQRYEQNRILQHGDLRERYGLDQLPAALAGFVEFVATLPEENRRARIEEFIEWIFTLDLRRLNADLHALEAPPHMTEGRCTECGTAVPRNQLRGVAAPGAYGSYCPACAEPIEARAARRLERRSIRSALHRARAARLPATLTEDEWRAACEHFDNLCAYCGESDWYVVEHATPIELGGGTTADNCVPACFSCNTHKGRTTLEAIRPSVLGIRAGRIEIVRAWLRSQGRR